MIKSKLQAAAENKVMHAISSFLSGYIFPAVYAVAALLSSLFGLEIAFYALTAAVALFTSLFCRDTRPYLTILVFVVYSTSWKHSSQHGSDFLYGTGVLAYIGVLVSLCIISMVFRMAVWNNGKNFFRDSRLRLGIILMCLAFVLNGAFYSGYTFSDLLFGLCVALSFFAAYIFFFSTLDIDGDMPKFMAYLLVLAGSLIILQIAKLYICDGVIVDGSIDKDRIKTGWGMSNNAGGMLALFMPACFYLAAKVKRGGWALYVLGFVFFGGICLTLSRTSVLVGGIVLAAAFIIFSIKKTGFRTFVWAFNGAAVIIGIVAVALLWDRLAEIFAVYLERGISDSGRFGIWLAGLKNFIKSPIFGVGFYEPIIVDGSPAYDIENWLMPDMYHNIFIQMLASCGLLGIVALIVHIAQVIMCTNRHPSADTVFYLSVIVVMIGICLLDNHIFHIFPAFIYSIFLLLTERDGAKSPLWVSRGILRGQRDNK